MANINRHMYRCLYPTCSNKAAYTALGGLSPITCANHRYDVVRYKPDYAILDTSMSSGETDYFDDIYCVQRHSIIIGDTYRAVLWLSNHVYIYAYVVPEKVEIYNIITIIETTYGTYASIKKCNNKKELIKYT